MENYVKMSDFSSEVLLSGKRQKALLKQVLTIVNVSSTTYHETADLLLEIVRARRKFNYGVKCETLREAIISRKVRVLRLAGSWKNWKSLFRQLAIDVEKSDSYIVKLNLVFEFTEIMRKDMGEMKKLVEKMTKDL